jgi:hypothetical protein
MGNNTAVPTCSPAQLLAEGGSSGIGSLCPVASQVGTITVDLITKTETVRSKFPLYNMEVTSFGVTAELGFKTVVFSQLLSVGVRPSDSGLTTSGSNVLEIGEARAVSATIWGVPASHVHDPERGEVCASLGGDNASLRCEDGGQEAKEALRPFLANPTNCSGPFSAGLLADSWEEAGLFSEASAEIPMMVECDRVPFRPSMIAKPTTDSAESSSGLEISMLVPQSWDSAETIATSNLKDTTVALPLGYTVNPSAGSGLGACTPAQLDAETSSSLPGEGCPLQSELGTVEVETPVLAENAKGIVYLAKPFDNPFDSLLAIYIVAKVPDRGIVVKVAGKVEPDPVTGQLVTTVKGSPQVPFSKFTLKFRQGATSPLVSPPACGEYTVQGALSPWSAPSEPRNVNSSFRITKGVGGGACPTGGTPPLNPHVVAGTISNAAGGYSPFYLRINREDGEQEITKFSTVLAPGITANLTGVPFCPDSAIEHARRATGQQEISDPSCPAISEIGRTLVGAGVGSVLAWTPGKVYLAGAYHGSALSVVSVTSAAVGPFDLGTVVIRFALRINPITAQAEIDSTGSDPIPHIIDGIVVHVRDIHVYIDRQKFMLNPTSCDRLRIEDTITGTGKDFTNPADQTPVSVGTSFQAADCQNLKFKPSFKVFVTGKTSRRNGAGLTVKLAYPKAPLGTQTDIRSVKVSLPRALPSRLSTLQKACPQRVFDANPAGCPMASRVGTAVATTPILPVALNGPAYFVSYGGAKFPELVIVLQGYGITVDLHGETFINKRGITSSTYRTIPDVPVNTFQLTLPQGPDSALAANTNLCAVSAKHNHKGKKKHNSVELIMPTTFTAQNNTIVKQNTPIAVTNCKHAPQHHTSHKQTNKKKIVSRVLSARLSK